VSQIIQRLHDTAAEGEVPLERNAIVLIDELDAHLHPDWQQQLTSRLNTLFPAVQFVGTTHSPLIVGGMEQRQVTVLQRRDGRVVKVPLPGDPGDVIRGRADQLLTGRLFGLATSVDIETRRGRTLPGAAWHGPDTGAGRGVQRTAGASRGPGARRCHHPGRAAGTGPSQPAAAGIGRTGRARGPRTAGGTGAAADRGSRPDAAGRRLTMRHVTFDPGNLDAEAISEDEKRKFPSWLAKAEDATRRAVEYYEREGKPAEEEAAIWLEHKKWLLRNKFDNKCAYCEKSLLDIPKDAEHWRPKRKMSGPDVRGHPGYFWLAYNWQNLLPACSMCNSYGGKNTQFPVAKSHIFRLKLTDAELDHLICRADAIPSNAEIGWWYPGVRDLDFLEEPLLLNPYVDEDPMVDLEFRPNGWIKPLSMKGEWSAKVFDLNRDDLRKARTKAEMKTENMVGLLFEYADEGGSSREVAEETAARFVTEKASYSAARRAALDREIARRKELLD
jgi:hypothetical protein